MKPEIIKGYSPEKLFAFFEEITRIPRGSGNEAAIASYLESFAKDRGLFCIRDSVNNVFIRCEATQGYENSPSVLLQGHTDMVCEKNADVEFDFLKDPINIYVDEEGFLRAKGTTLGADNGVAVAIMLALLDGECVEHPALECLFTVEEETGLDGAKAFDYSVVKSKKMINLDSENDREVVVGCAGGNFHKATIPCGFEKGCGNVVKLSIGGLMGGHSGANINSGRANANKLLGRLLLETYRECDFNLVSIEGGSKDNAIPREANALVSVSDTETFCNTVKVISNRISGELSAEDGGFCLDISACDNIDMMFDTLSTRKIISFISSVQNGVIEMSKNISGLVEFSRNLGIISTNGNNVEFIFSARSAIDSQLDYAATEIENLAEIYGGRAEQLGRYPGWEYAKVSPLREKFLSIYREVMGSEPEVNVIHAGLECGIIKSYVKDMDIISIGPSMRDIHSPDEALDLASFERTWQMVCKLLK